MVFSSKAKKFGIFPTVAITTVPPFFTDLMAVSVTSSTGANTIAASNKPYPSVSSSRNFF